MYIKNLLLVEQGFVFEVMCHCSFQDTCYLFLVKAKSIAAVLSLFLHQQGCVKFIH